MLEFLLSVYLLILLFAYAISVAGSSHIGPEQDERLGWLLCYVSPACLSPPSVHFSFGPPRSLYLDVSDLYARADVCSGST